MKADRVALDILIEDLALQLLSAVGADRQAQLLEQRLSVTLEAQPSRKAVRNSTGVSRIEVRRVLTGISNRTGQHAQEMRSLVHTLDWNLRLYLARRDSESEGPPRRKTVARKAAARRER